MIERLLAIAEELAKSGAHSLTMKRRAVSTAYYAVFHALAETCADTLAGEDASEDDYIRVYRALDHNTLKSAFTGAPLNALPDVQKIGNRAVELQSERIRSDYMPSKRLYTKAACLKLVESARSTVKEIASLPPDQKRTLAITLIIKSRK